MFTLAELITPIVIFFFIVIVANASFRVLGRYTSTRGPGLIFLVPWFQQIVRVDLRTVVIEVPSQDVIIIQVEQYLAATNMPAQTTLRSVLGQHELDDRTKEWGILVTAVEIRDVQLTDNMVKAIAKQAEAERDRRAKVIHAEAEFHVPAAMQLRYLQTLTEIGGEHNSTVVFPMPLDIVKPFLDIIVPQSGGKNRSAEPERGGPRAQSYDAEPGVGSDRIVSRSDRARSAARSGRPDRRCHM